MKQAELDAAVKVVRDVVYAKMQEKGFAQYIPELEKQVDVVDVVRYGLQAAEDERKTCSRRKRRNESIYSWLGPYPGWPHPGFGSVGSTDLGIQHCPLVGCSSVWWVCCPRSVLRWWWLLANS
jgi:hypothetical protein